MESSLDLAVRDPLPGACRKQVSILAVSMYLYTAGTCNMCCVEPSGWHTGNRPRRNAESEISHARRASGETNRKFDWQIPFAPVHLEDCVPCAGTGRTALVIRPIATPCPLRSFAWRRWSRCPLPEGPVQWAALAESREKA